MIFRTKREQVGWLRRAIFRCRRGAVGTWKPYSKFKKALLKGSITFGAGVFKLCLFRTSASAIILKITNGGVSAFASLVGEISATGGYAAGGKNLVPATGQVTAGASAHNQKFTMSSIGLALTGPLNNVRYAGVRNSTGAGAGRMIAFCTLSTVSFNIASGNLLTLLPASNGILNLA